MALFDGQVDKARRVVGERPKNAAGTSQQISCGNRGRHKSDTDTTIGGSVLCSAEGGLVAADTDTKRVTMKEFVSSVLFDFLFSTKARRDKSIEQNAPKCRSAVQPGT